MSLNKPIFCVVLMILTLVVFLIFHPVSLEPPRQNMVIVTNQLWFISKREVVVTNYVTETNWVQVIVNTLSKDDISNYTNPVTLEAWKSFEKSRTDILRWLPSQSVTNTPINLPRLNVPLLSPF